MRNTSLLLLLLCSLSFSQGKVPNGFQNIMFGTAKEAALDSLRKSDSTIQFEKYDDFISANRFPLGDRYFTLYLRFNKNGKFYRYSFSSRGRPANEFDPDVIEDAKYLSKIFQAKFGKPASKSKPYFPDIRQNYISYYWKWDFEKLDIYTGFSEYEGEFDASAVVTDKILEREQKIELTK